MSFYELFDIVVYEAIKNQSLYSLVPPRLRTVCLSIKPLWRVPTTITWVILDQNSKHSVWLKMSILDKVSVQHSYLEKKKIFLQI